MINQFSSEHMLIPIPSSTESNIDLDFSSDVNSAVNPLIYALHHSEFKQVWAFWWISSFQSLILSQVFAEYWRSCISFFFFCNTRWISVVPQIWQISDMINWSIPFFREEPLPETDSQQMRVSSSTSSKAKRPSVAVKKGSCALA